MNKYTETVEVEELDGHCRGLLVRNNVSVDES